MVHSAHPGHGAAHVGVYLEGVYQANALGNAQKPVLKALGGTGRRWNVSGIVGARKCALLVHLGVACGQQYTPRPRGAAHVGVYLEG